MQPSGVPTDTNQDENEAANEQAAFQETNFWFEQETPRDAPSNTDARPQDPPQRPPPERVPDGADRDGADGFSTTRDTNGDRNNEKDTEDADPKKEKKKDKNGKKEKDNKKEKKEEKEKKEKREPATTVSSEINMRQNDAVARKPGAGRPQNASTKMIFTYNKI